MVQRPRWNVAARGFVADYLTPSLPCDETVNKALHKSRQRQRKFCEDFIEPIQTNGLNERSLQFMRSARVDKPDNFLSTQQPLPAVFD